jgi:hypothetical protein
MPICLSISITISNGFCNTTRLEILTIALGHAVRLEHVITVNFAINHHFLMPYTNLADS